MKHLMLQSLSRFIFIIIWMDINIICSCYIKDFDLKYTRKKRERKEQKKKEKEKLERENNQL